MHLWLSASVISLWHDTIQEITFFPPNIYSGPHFAALILHPITNNIKSPMEKATYDLPQDLRCKINFSYFFTSFWKWNLTIQSLLSAEIKCCFGSSLNCVLSTQQARAPTKNSIFAYHKPCWTSDARSYGN